MTLKELTIACLEAYQTLEDGELEITLELANEDGDWKDIEKVVRAEKIKEYLPISNTTQTVFKLVLR